MLRKVRTKNGWVRGFPAADPRITVFKGIPFAAPPVGKLRWHAPMPARDWDGTLECYEFAPMAMQYPIKADPNALYDREWHVDPDHPMSEDCLYLNIWTPAKTGDEKFPVMVWIFGGGLMCGYPSEMEFDGERIARRGVILVSINYRLNVFGFLCHPEITAESPEKPANFGHLDQQAGIQWVKRNIAAFGGDPDNITIFGQSAGGGSVLVQVASPQNKGLFQKAILQSSGGMLPPSSFAMNIREAEQQGVRLFKELGVKSLDEARMIDAKTVFEAAVTSGGGYQWGTVVGDPFLMDYPVNYFKYNTRNKVALMVGHTADEFPIVPQGNTIEELEEYAKRTFGEHADEYLALIKKGSTTLEEMKAKGTYNGFELGDVLLLDNNSKFETSDAYYYIFDPEIPGWDNPGAFHSSELWFVFETLAKCWRPFKGKHYDLARMMCNYWTNFAKSGDPNGLDADGTPMPEWKPYAKEQRGAMFFGDEPKMVGPNENEVFNFIREGYEKGYFDNRISNFAQRRRQNTPKKKDN
ncbi:MAG TPA: carboxylesterase family protein [Bacillota bacterium]|nr:carboxylesterase family protein [Bacillota bacterium]